MTTTPISWPEAQRICDIPEVREALDKFAVDACEENMLPMVSMIMWHAASQGRAAGPVPIGMAAGGRPVYWQQKPLSPAMCALIESGQLEDGDADLMEPQGQALPVADERCPYCDGTGDVHDRTGQWLGTCWPCADANLIAALGETAKGCQRFESVLPQPSQFEGHFSTAYLTQQQDELFSLLSPDSVLRLVHLARAALADEVQVAAKAATVHKRIDSLCTATNTPGGDYFDASTRLMLAVRELLVTLGRPHTFDIDAALAAKDKP